MFNSDLTANRPAAGIVGRIFIATDSPYGIFRDTGTAWDQIAGAGGGGGISGSGAATQVAFWTGASAISGSNNLWWDSTNNYLGISTNTPTTALDVHHSTNSGAIFNQTTGTNNNTINFQTSGSGRWRIGNFYTAGADDFGIFDVVGSMQQLTIVKTTGQTYIGAKTTASGRLVVNSATADAHLQIVGANGPSIRIDNVGSGGTQRFAIGNATAANNFIQGSTAGQFCITTASSGAMLFGMWQTTNATEVMRISTASNLLIGTTTDAGFKVDITGTARVSGLLTINGGTSPSITAPDHRYLFGGSGTGTDAIKIGQIGNANGNYSIAIQNGATASGLRSIAIGTYANASGTDCISLGAYSIASSNEFQAGGYYSITNVYFGSGSSRGNVTDGVGVAYTINGSGAKGTDFAGGNIIIAGGKGTGSGTSGDVIISTATPTTSGITLQTLTSRWYVKGSTGSLSNVALPNASAQLQVDSTTQGILPPRMTTTQKNSISTPAAGLMVYDSTLNKLCVYTTAWETITSI
jgi:hypothetical protein